MKNLYRVELLTCGCSCCCGGGGGCSCGSSYCSGCSFCSCGGCRCGSFDGCCSCCKKFLDRHKNSICLRKSYFFKVDLETKKFLDSYRVGFSMIYNSVQKAKMVVVMAFVVIAPAGKHACFTFDENHFLLN